MKKVLIAGVTGYLGQHIVKEFKKHGFWVRALARNAARLENLSEYIDEKFERRPGQIKIHRGVKRIRIKLFGISLIVLLLLLPLIFKNKNRTEFYGPDLSELEYSRIFFNNDNEGFKLAGMLMLPEGKGPFPTVVIIHGSGPSRRNSKSVIFELLIKTKEEMYV